MPEENIEEYYPGDEWVDWVGVDFYTDRYFLGDPSQPPLTEAIYRQGELADPLDHLRFVYERYAARKPIMIAETGVSGAITRTGEKFTPWAVNNIARLYGYLPLLYPRVKAIFYFDVENSLVPVGNRLWANYSLVQDQAVLEAYRRQIRSPYYLGAPGATAGFRYRKLERLDGLLAREALSLATYVRLPVPVVDRVEYWVDGRLAATRTEPPFAFEWAVAGGTHALDVRAFGRGQLRARRTYSVGIEDGRLSVAPGLARAIPVLVRLRDVDGHWSKAEVEELAAQGIAGGYPDRTFRPEGKITRAEFYKLMAVALGLNAMARTSLLPGVPATHWARDLLEGGVSQGIIPLEEYVGGFSPDGQITRGEMAAWLVRALDPGLRGRQAGTSSTSFTDDGSIPSWQRPYVSLASDWGLIQGYGDGTFRAARPATRAEAVVMVRRAVVRQQQIVNQK